MNRHFGPNRAETTSHELKAFLKGFERLSLGTKRILLVNCEISELERFKIFFKTLRKSLTKKVEAKRKMTLLGNFSFQHLNVQKAKL